MNGYGVWQLTCWAFSKKFQKPPKLLLKFGIQVWFVVFGGTAGIEEWLKSLQVMGFPQS